MSIRPLLKTQVLMEFKSAVDGRPVYIDPEHATVIKAAEPGDDSLTHPATVLVMYAHGGSLVVEGDVDEVVYAIQEARTMTNEVTLGALMDLVDAHAGNRDNKSKLN